MKGLDAVTAQSRASPQTTKPTYREYQKFLKTYNENKSDQSASPTALSTNSSASSVPSMITETDNVPVAFNEYLQNYGSMKYNAVKLNLPKKNVKTELFIQVNDEEDKEGLHGRKYNTLRSRKVPGKVILARQNSLNKCDSWKGPMSPAAHQVALSPPPAKQEVVPDEMIYAKTAFLSELTTKPPKLNKSPSPTLKTAVESSTNSTSVSSLPPPPPKLPDFTNTTPPISSTVKKVTPARTAEPKPSQNRPSFISEMQNRFNENAQNRLPPRLSSIGVVQNGSMTGSKKSPPLNNTNLPPPPPKFLTQVETNSSGLVTNGVNTGKKSPTVSNSNVSVAPKFLTQLSKSSDSDNSTTSSKSGQNGTAVTNGKKSPPLTNSNLPPPPPKFLTKQTKTIDAEPNTMTYVPVADSTANVDKSDPNVKKLVYNTYRGLLGAYNNKANNMVTMPRNRVVQDQGITKQLESIELQGCLGKLNGRVNPSGENE